MIFDVKNKFFGTIKQAAIIVTLDNGYIFLHWQFLGSSQTSDAENLLKYGVHFDPSQKYVPSMQSKYWSSEIKRKYVPFKDIQEPCDVISVLNDHAVALISSNNIDEPGIDYFSKKSDGVKEYYTFNIPDNCGEMYLFDSYLDITNPRYINTENASVKIQFDNTEFYCRKILMVIVSPEEMTGKLHISTLIYNEQLDPLRNKNEYFLRNDYYKLTRDLKTDFREILNSKIDPVSGILLSDKDKTLVTSLNYPILYKKILTGKITWCPTTCYNKGDLVNVDDVLSNKWQSVIDGNIGNHPMISPFWIKLSSIQENSFDISITLKADRYGIVLFDKTRTSKIFLSDTNAPKETGLLINVFPKKGYVFKQLDFEVNNKVYSANFVKKSDSQYLVSIVEAWSGLIPVPSDRNIQLVPKFVSKTDYQNITVSYELKFKYLSDILDKDDPLINNITIMAKMPTSYETLELIGLSGEYLLYQKVLSSGSGSPSGFFAKADDYYLLSGRTLFPRNNEEFYQLGGSRSTILIGKNRPIVNISTESDLIQIEDDFIGSTIESNVFVASFLYYSEDLGRKCNIRCSDEGVEITNIRETITISNQEILVYRVKLSKLLPDTVYDISLY